MTDVMNSSGCSATGPVASRKDQTHRAKEVVSGPTLLDVRAVAALFSCSTRHVYRLADAGRMPAPVHLGGLVRWCREKLEQWIDGGCLPIRTIAARRAV